MRRIAGLAVVAALAACAAPVAPPPDPAVCAVAFARYDTAVRLHPVTPMDEDGGLVPPGPLSRPVESLRRNRCVTRAEDLDGLPALAAGLAPYTIAAGGSAIDPPVPVHLGIVAGIADEALVTRAFRGLGYRSRGVGAEGLGRRIYIGPFDNEAALEQALALGREAGFIAPYAATYTRF